jgi:hypothetical protein
MRTSQNTLETISTIGIDVGKNTCAPVVKELQAAQRISEVQRNAQQ